MSEWYSSIYDKTSNDSMYAYSVQHFFVLVLDVSVRELTLFILSLYTVSLLPLSRGRSAACVLAAQGFAGWYITSAKRGDNINTAMTNLLEHALEVHMT